MVNHFEKSDLIFLENWEKKPAGKWKYIFLYGVLYFSLPAMLISTGLNLLLDLRTLTDFYNHWYIDIIIWDTIGIGFGWHNWMNCEKRYRKIKEKEWKN